MKIRKGIIKSRQAGIPGGGVTGWCWRRRLRKVLVTREKRTNDEWNVRGREKHQQATRGSNLPGRRDFASEAGANC